MKLNIRCGKLQNSNSRRRDILLGGVALAALGLANASAFAEDYQFGDFDVKLNGTATLGTAIRTVGPNPALIPPANGAAAKITGKALGGLNSSDGDLNYAVGEPVSSVVKGVASIDISKDNVGVFVRGKFWYDYTLSNQSAAWGDIATGYAPGEKLNDSQFGSTGKFANATLGEAYAYAKGSIGGDDVEGRIGNINVPWGLKTIMPGGLMYAVDAVDLNAFYRPGTLREEFFEPSAGAYAKADLTKNLSVQGFWKFEPAHNDLLECGTFYSTLNYQGTGCNNVVFGPFSSPAALAHGYDITRDPTPDHHALNAGIGTTYKFDPLTTLGLYYAHVDSTTPNASPVIGERSLAVPFIPHNPGGLNGAYLIDYAPNVDVFAVNFQKKVDETSIYGEYTYKPDAPVQLNALDLLNGLVSATGPTPLRASMNAAAPGSVYNGYDRHQLGNLVLGAIQNVPNVLGATTMVLSGEADLKQVYDLPSQNLRRYGRSDLFGQGPVNGICPAPQGPGQCTTSGYVSSNAYGYRLRAEFQYDDVLGTGVMLMPRVGLAHDINGWSADGQISERRMLLTLGVQAEYTARYFAQVFWNPALVNGPYDAASDRQVVEMSVGVRF